jgi:CRISPR-associated endonuclease Csn1
MKKILGLDLGTNSIGWALVEQDFEKKIGTIQGLGSRIIPMSQDILGKFDSGVSISQTAERTAYRGIRRLYQKNVLRRERLHRVLNILEFLPKHYANSIDFEDKLGQFKDGKEVKLNYRRNISGKYEFIFKDSFEEMVKEFETKSKQVKIPYDWTLYYLRKKALNHKITKEELAWIILNFNQKRGYYQLRGEDEKEDENKIEEFFSLKVIEVESTGDKNHKGIWYNVKLENDWIYRRQSKEPLGNWVGKTKEFIITTQKNLDGTLKCDKEGNAIRSFRAVDSEKDWIAIKKRTERDIEKSKKTVGEYIYESILEIPSQKIRGKLVRTIERKYYKEELKKILETQIKYHSELSDNMLLLSCINELYPRNEAHQNLLKEKGIMHFILEDIIFYQRPLKSKKSSISNCQYEFRAFKNKEGKVQKNYLKAIPKSNPLFQEFRLWQFLKNLKIYQKEKIINGKSETDVTNQLLPDEDAWVELFDFLNTKKEIEQKQVLDYFVKKSLLNRREKDQYRWNYVEDKKYPCNETKAMFLSRLKKVKGVDPEIFLSNENEKNLWHIIYSISDKNEYEKALGTFASKHSIDVMSFIENFKKFPPFKSDYGAYSEKAIKKLLPLMRRGTYWEKAKISEGVKQRIDRIIERLRVINFDKKLIDENVADDDIPKQVLKSFAEFENRNYYQGLNTYQACYAVYNRHSETSLISRWKSPDDITKFLNEFKQHSLRNPIVEQVVTETLRVVKNIWEHYGSGAEHFFDEIHIELGREMQNPADKRKKLTERITTNENTNQRIRELLKEIMYDDAIEGKIRPYSPSHQEILKIYEEGIYQNPNTEYFNLSADEIEKIRKNSNPSSKDITRYKLWLEQGYISPYTGQPIQLSRLFTTDYQIEHIIPQSRYFDDSLSNKIICESEVNQLKGNSTAYEFLKNEKGRIVTLTQGKTVKLFTIEHYEEHCNNYFKNNRAKLKKLLSDEIPEGFIERQMNDSRYISKLVMGLLSNVVRHDNELEATSKSVIPLSGSITSKLKFDWGLNDRWNEIIAPRFKRLNMITNSNNFGYWDNEINAFRPTVPDEIARGFNKKRIDHRHHALDALVIACANRRHIHYLNALNAENKNYTLCDLLLIKNKQGDFTKHFILPWSDFTTHAKNKLESTVISFKQNLRIINKTNNKTWQWVEKDGTVNKEMVRQTKGDSWAIRKPMHKDTVSGKVEVRIRKTISFSNGLKDWKSLVDKQLKNKIRELCSQGKNDKEIAKYFKENPYPSNENRFTKVEVYTLTKNATAIRTALTDKFTLKQLENVTDSGIRKILESHLNNYMDENGNKHFDLAFNPDGLDELNKNIKLLNGGKFHHPIHKVRIYEEGNKFKVGESGNKSKKFVEAAKGTNLFFAIYWNTEKQKREFETIPLNEVITHQKWSATLSKDDQKLIPAIPVNHEKGEYLFSLSPNDLVYVPTEEEIANPNLVNFEKLNSEQVNRIYKMVSSTGNECHFIQEHVSTLIISYNSKSKLGEFGSLNKMEIDMYGIRIKEVCWKLKVDRLGNVLEVIR